MSKLCLFMLLVIAVSALDLQREGHHPIDRPNTDAPHRHYTLQNGNLGQSTMEIPGQHGPKNRPFRDRQHPFINDRWPAMKFLPDHHLEFPKIIRNQREQAH